MILRLILKNFLSFDNEAQFDMFPNMKRTQLAGYVSYWETYRNVPSWLGMSIQTFVRFPC